MINRMHAATGLWIQGCNGSATAESLMYQTVDFATRLLVSGGDVPGTVTGLLVFLSRDA